MLGQKETSSWWQQQQRWESPRGPSVGGLHVTNRVICSDDCSSKATWIMTQLLQDCKHQSWMISQDPNHWGLPRAPGVQASPRALLLCENKTLCRDPLDFSVSLCRQGPNPENDATEWNLSPTAAVRARWKRNNLSWGSLLLLKAVVGDKGCLRYKLLVYTPLSGCFPLVSLCYKLELNGQRQKNRRKDAGCLPELCTCHTKLQ